MSYSRIQRPRSRRVGRRTDGQPPLAPGNLPPGIIHRQHVAPIGTGGLVFDRSTSGFLLPTTAAFTCGSNGTGAWGAPANTERLAVRLGPAAGPMDVWVFGSVGWLNGSDAAFHGRVCVTVFDGPIGTLGTGGVRYERATNVPSAYLNNDSKLRLFSIATYLTLPEQDGADWHLTLSFQNDISANKGSQQVNRQSLVAFATAAIPGADGTLTADAGLV